MNSDKGGTNIERMLSEYRYDIRRKSHPDECPCYSGKKCHDIEDLNCYLCYCPFYDTEKQEGGCLKDNPYSKGKWFEHANLPKGKIWDCSDCTFPHIEKNIREYILQDTNADTSAAQSSKIMVLEDERKR